MNFYYLVGEAVVAAALAFGATLYRKKGGPAVSIMRRFVSALVIYAVCLVSLLIVNLAVSKVAALNPNDFEPPFMLLAALVGYVIGKRVVVQR